MLQPRFIEYGLIAGLVCVAIIVALTALGGDGSAVGVALGTHAP